MIIYNTDLFCYTTGVICIELSSIYKLLTKKRFFFVENFEFPTSIQKFRSYAISNFPILLALNAACRTYCHTHKFMCNCMGLTYFPRGRNLSNSTARCKIINSLLFLVRLFFYNNWFGNINFNSY